MERAAPITPGPMDWTNLSDEKLASIMTFLVTFGYIDGVFDPAEQQMVATQMHALVGKLVEGTTPDARQRAQLTQRLSSVLDGVYERASDQIEAFMDEGPRGDDVSAGAESFLYARLKVRCLEIFRTFTSDEQTQLLILLEQLIVADGKVTPEEKRMREQLVATMSLPVPTLQPGAPAAAPPMRLAQIHVLPPQAEDHSFLQPLEQPFSPHPVELASQLERDVMLMGQAINLWEAQRARGRGRLRGVERLAQLPAGASFLDEHIYVQRADPIRPLEVIVLGDLHGCYSCLKAALLQSDFIRRVWLHQWDPVRYPDVKLVCVGDYIDRGRFSLDGVLRVVLQLFVAMPDNVYVLRGNHESFVRTWQGIRSMVYPAEAIGSLAPHAPPAVLEAYLVLFEAMPTMFLSERTMVVHGGIPRDDTFAETYRDLSSLNHADLRFQMMWSDPALAEHVPVELQRENPRFSFGARQFRQFMERTGFQTMIRGHEKIDEGFRVIYDLRDMLLLNLFSAGGAGNADLPLASSYRKVRPMALTIMSRAGQEDGYPWVLDWQTFNAPSRNGFLRGLPELPFLSG